MERTRRFLPETETQAVIPETTFLRCGKPENHDVYKSPFELQDEDLPQTWRQSDVLRFLKLASKRVVHLTVLRSSPSRQSRYQDKKKAFYGTGSLTFDPAHGAVVHTSKHVVYDPYEADKTIVRLHYEEENSIAIDQAIEKFKTKVLNELDGKKESVSEAETNALIAVNEEAQMRPGLFLSKGNCRHFQSTNYSDYTSFSCDLPIHELFSEKEINELSKSFSWFNFSVKKLKLRYPKEIDISIISHPHGYQKKISFGKMNRLCNVTPALYDAATCAGSSGAPLIRLKEDTGHINIGTFIHHGHDREILNRGVGLVRPPLTFPYSQCLDTENMLTNTIDILYEPVFYWTLFFCDILHLEATFINVLDVFAYTSSLSALLGTVDCVFFKVLFTCYWIHILLKATIDTSRSGLYYAMCHVASTFISMGMFLVAWLILALYPLGPWWTEFFAIVVWSIVLYLERYFHLAGKFQMRMMGSFLEVLELKLLYELGIKANTRKKSSKLVTVSF